MRWIAQVLPAFVLGWLLLMLGACSSGGGGSCTQACAKLIHCFQQECAVDPKPECAEVPTQSECEAGCARGWKWDNACLVDTDCAHIGQCE